MQANLSGLKVEVKEKVIPTASQLDLNDTQSAFYEVNQKMWDMIKDMNVEQRMKLNDMISKAKEKMS